jgi:hypothetical protein
MKLTSKILKQMIREQLKEGHYRDPNPTVFTGEPDLQIPSMEELTAAMNQVEPEKKSMLVQLADQLTVILDKIEALVPDVFNAERSPEPHGMSDDDIIDQERAYANERPMEQ